MRIAACRHCLVLITEAQAEVLMQASLLLAAGLSKAAKRRAKDKEKGRQATFAQRTAPGEVRVLNHASAAPPPPAAREKR